MAKSYSTAEAVSYILDSEFDDNDDDNESCLGMDSEEEEELDIMLMQDEFEVVDTVSHR